jgi:hypothetical protein
MIRTLAGQLGISPDNILPYARWLECVAQCSAPTSDNPAKQLLDFFSNDFIRMSCGGLVLDTSKAREHSETLRGLKPVSDNLVELYLSKWKAVGFLDPQSQPDSRFVE